MKKWYRNNIIKAILIGVAHVASVILIVALVWILACPSSVRDTFFGAKNVEYSDTPGFTDKVFVNSVDFMENYSKRQEWAIEDEIDRTKIIDIEIYKDKNHIINKNENGIAYTMDELIKWADAMDQNKCESSYIGVKAKNPIIVCQKEDGSYEYFYYMEFKQMVEAKELHLILNNDSYSDRDVLGMAREGTLNTGHLSSVLDADRRVKYIDCWSFDGVWIEEIFKPQDAENILAIANADARWNGRLSEAFQMIDQVAHSIRDMVAMYEGNKCKLDEGNTNVSCLFVDLDKQIVYSNKGAYADFENLEESIHELTSHGKYLIVRPTLKDFETNMTGADSEIWLSTMRNYADSNNFLYVVAVDTEFPVPDEYAQEYAEFLKYTPYMTTAVCFGIAASAVLMVCLVWLTVIAGRQPEDDEIHLNAWDKWKTEISAMLVIGVWGSLVALVSEVMWQEQLFYAGMIGFLTCMFFLIGYLSLVRRIKGKTLWQNSLMRELFRVIKRFAEYMLEHLPVLWKSSILFGVFVILHWIAIATRGGALFLAVGMEIIVFIILLHVTIGKKKIRNGIERISNGEMDYKIDLNHLYGQQLEIAEMVNNIGDGFQAAVEKSMKSERLKTDLITNVSHDIRTPLTSIINYIDLLKREGFTDSKVQGYLNVLESKAQRLKTLTEDVLEASKVSSGNVSLEKMKINFVEMIQQTSGEFEEKFKKRGLKEVLNLPSVETIVYVDGRRMWRVLENIYSNAAKYSMEGTRVYADVKEVNNQVVFSLKNISEQPLNISADELTERFIRGDISRNTEGSGLGLSIAKSLTEMQGGIFEIYLDGDLFKVTISFPKC